MDHEDAVRHEIAARYLLDQLDPAQRDAFEEHYFDCRACAEDVQAGSTFLDAARPEVLPPPLPAHAPVLALEPRAAARRAPGPPRGAWYAALTGLAAALVLAAYQGLVVIPRLQGEVQDFSAVRAVPSRFLSVSRGEPVVVAVPAGERQVALTLSQSWGLGSYPSYRCTLRDAHDDEVRAEGTVTPTSIADEMEILVPLRGLAAGPYTVVVEGLAPGSPRPGKELARYAFTLERR